MKHDQNIGVEYITFLETVLDHLSEAVYMGDQDGNIYFINKEAEQNDGIPREKVIGHTEEEIYGTMNSRLVADTGKAIKNEKVAYQTRDGNNKYTLHSVYPFIYQGQLKGNFSISKDITKEDHYITKIYQLQQELKHQKKHANNNNTRYTLEDILGKSLGMLMAIRHAERVSQFDTSVLICGETGTGKEMFAQGIHNASRYKSAPFVALNCGAVPENLLESILFGTEKGAFTGSQNTEGMIAQAKNGTLFLDEIDSMDWLMQAKILRVLQEKRYRKVGGKEELIVACRIISATNLNIEQALAEKKIRSDLYYRLAAVVINIPPLR